MGLSLHEFRCFVIVSKSRYVAPQLRGCTGRSNDLVGSARLERDGLVFDCSCTTEEKKKSK